MFRAPNITGGGGPPRSDHQFTSSNPTLTTAPTTINHAVRGVDTSYHQQFTANVVIQTPQAPIGAHELALLLKAPAVATRHGALLAWASAMPFTDSSAEREFMERSTIGFMNRLPFVFMIAAVTVVGVVSARLPSQVGSSINSFNIAHLVSFTCVGVFFVAVMLAFRNRMVSARHARVIMEALGMCVFPAITLTMPTVTSATFVAIYTLFLAVLIRPNLLFALATTIGIVIAWVISVSEILPHVTENANSSVFDEAAIMVVVFVVCGYMWIDSNISDRISFTNERAVDHTWRATQRLLSVTLPHQILPTLIEHANSHADWSGMPATAEPNVTIIFVRFPPLTHAVFPASASAAVAQLNSLWALCDATGKALGITTLELTDTEFVGIVGLGGGGTDADTEATVRAGLAIIAALPPAFAAVVVVGVHSGAVAAGFVGTLRPRFTLVGDTMNTASRMASASKPGHLTISLTTFARINHNLFEASKREVIIKGKGAAIVYDIMREIFRPHIRRASLIVKVDAPATQPEESKKPESLSRRFAPHPFTLAGFDDKDTEARFNARPVFFRHSQFVAAIIVSLLFYLLSNNGEAPALMGRVGVNITYLFAACTLGIATVVAPGSRSVVAATTIGLIVYTLSFPFFGQRLSSVFFSSIVLFFSPNHFFSVLQRSCLYVILAIMITTLVQTGYYSTTDEVINSGLALVWMWISLLASIVGYVTLDRQVRRGFARAEALILAQGVADDVLMHLLPRSLIDRIAAGDELNALTTENDDVAVLVADIVGFTALSAAATSPAHIFNLVNSAFREFERVAHAEGAFKVKTLGDCIVFAAGLRDFPGPAADRAARVALLERVARGMHGAAAHLSLRMRVGIHVGSLVSGVMNSRGFVYDVWGEAILLATAAETAAAPGGTVFSAEAAAVLDPEIARVLTPFCHANSTVSFFSMTVIEPVRVVDHHDPPPLIVDFERIESNSVDEFSSTLQDNRLNADGKMITPSTPSSMRLRSLKTANSEGSSSNLKSKEPFGWSYDILNGNSEAHLRHIALELLRPALDKCTLISEKTATVVTAELIASYGNHPFHNAYHGVATMQVVIMIARTVPALSRLLSDFDLLLIGFAALGHDAGHRGFNNIYEVASRSAISLSYGIEGPVLERFHAANTVTALESTGALASLSPTMRAAALHTITAAIMATDMARHDSIVSEFLRCGTLGSIAPDSLMGSLVHVADLSAHVFPLSVSLAWSARISEEFSAQVASEEAHGLPTATFMADLDTPLARARMQSSFIQGVVAPLWRSLSALAEGALDEPMYNIAENTRHYSAELSRLTEDSASLKGLMSRLRGGSNTNSNNLYNAMASPSPVLRGSRTNSTQSSPVMSSAEGPTCVIFAALDDGIVGFIAPPSPTLSVSINNERIRHLSGIANTHKTSSSSPSPPSSSSLLVSIVNSAIRPLTVTRPPLPPSPSKLLSTAVSISPSTAATLTWGERSSRSPSVNIFP